MTQLERYAQMRYAQMMKVSLDKVQAHIVLRVGAEGSMLAQTVQARAESIGIHYEIESGDEPVRIAGLVRNARNGCYVRQTIDRPDLFHDTINLNGHPFDIGEYLPPAR